MELQQRLPDFKAAGIAVFAISYDPVDALATFADEHAIEYRLLSDERSDVIREFGILNTLVLPDEPVYGIPFPGSYLVDEQGLVAEKFFHREYQVRETAATVLRSGFGVAIDLAGSPTAESTVADVSVSAMLAANELKFMQRADLYVRITLAEGLHVNGQPAPEGYFATEVEVSGPEGLRVGEPRFPATTPFRIEGLNEQFQVFEGDVEIAVPLISAIREGDAVSIEVEVRYQACNDHECFLPSTERLRLTAPLGRINRPRPRS